METEEYNEKVLCLEECRKLATQVHGCADKAEKWLAEKSDSFWNLSPLECIRTGKGEEVLSMLQAKVQASNPETNQ